MDVEKIKKIVIVGAGGMGGDTQWLIERINQEKTTYQILGYIDDGKSKGTKVNGYSVLGGMEYLIDHEEPLDVAFAIGNVNTRQKLIEKCLKNKNLNFPNLVDPSVIMSDQVKIGKGNIICTSVILTMNIEIGNFNLICNRSIVGHDDKLGSYNTLYPGSLLSGNVHLEDRIEIGTGSQIIQGICIKSDIILGAGTTVIRDIKKSGTYVGCPARRVDYEK